MLNKILIFSFLIFTNISQAQQGEAPGNAMKEYIAEQSEVNKRFISYFYSDYRKINSLPEPIFVRKIDSLKQSFNAKVDQYRSKLDRNFLDAEKAELNFFFDKLLLDYTNNYNSFTGKRLVLPEQTQNRLNKNLLDFNKPQFLSNPQFIKYVRAYFEATVGKVLKMKFNSKLDNRKLLATHYLVDSLFTDSRCNEYWKYTFLRDHIENFGIKNIEDIYKDYVTSSVDTSHANQIVGLYQGAEIARKDHPIAVYKKVKGIDLDMHLFLPDSSYIGKRPVIIFFHGGSWTEGKPDWAFGACKEYAAKGWVACAAEYRIQARHGTLPFASVMDAKSAIRWMRKNSDTYNVDTNKIIATGNSSGGHLVLTAALSKSVNEQTDDIHINASPDYLLVNAGVYDLMDENTAWIRKSAKSIKQVKAISPLHLIQKGFPKALLIHGTNDRNCPYRSAKEFAARMKEAGNQDIELVSLEGASHFIWFDPRYSQEVSKYTQEFLKKQGL
ncbi:MAG TPA: alpha/beta hydrolase [Flavisolibacter sp.]|nr:alpha/beta hydrolase [Flavisolibacter sp.]